MKKSTFLAFAAYIWTKTLLGLTFHPFKSTKGVVRRPILLPVIFSPLIGLTILFIVGRIAALFISPHGFKREIIVLFLSTTLLSILFWQLLLLYLLGSFFIALRKK
jgi:hypothetical protein